MARIARKNLETTFFHVVVQGIEKKYIFEKEIYKKRYLNLIIEEINNFSIKILAFCIMDNHAHILLNTDNSLNMSKFMHKINFKFAQFYNSLEDERVGYVFRDRFSSEAIMDEKHLLNCIIYIHNNPVKANMVNDPSEYKYSSYNNFKNRDGIINYKTIKNLLDISLVTKNEIEEDYVFFDTEQKTKDVVKQVINRYLKKYNIDIINPRKDKAILRDIITNLKNHYNITYKEISKNTGISVSTIRRVLNKNE